MIEKTIFTFTFTFVCMFLGMYVISSYNDRKKGNSFERMTPRQLRDHFDNGHIAVVTTRKDRIRQTFVLALISTIAGQIIVSLFS